MQGFSPSSKFLQKKWGERQHRLHVEKVQSMRAGVNNVPPKKYPHMALRLKQVQKEEQRKIQIEHENLLLLRKMSVIMQHRGRLDNWNAYQTKSLNYLVRENEQDKIATQNMSMAKRLGAIKPIYAANRWEEEFHKHEYYLEMWGNSTKDFGFARQKGPYCDNDLEDDSSGKLPKIESDTQRTSTTSMSESHKSEHLPKLPQRKSLEDVTAEADAKLLFSACTQLAKGDAVILKTLLRRTHAQRVATKEKFHKLYDLDLESELCGAMGAGYTELISCLLGDQVAADTCDARKAIKDNDAAGLVDIFCSKKGLVLSDIKKVYKTAYGISLEGDIRQFIEGDDCQEFLIHLSTSGRSKSEQADAHLADQIADQLYDAGIGRFTEKKSKFMALLKEESMAQIKATFDSYMTTSGGVGIADSMQEDGCHDNLVLAVRSLETCLAAKSALFVQKIHGYIMRTDQKQLIRLLLDKYWTSMPAIRKAYRKAYGSNVMGDIVSRCGTVGPLIAHIAAGPKAKESVKRVNGIVIPQPSRQPPLRRPAARRELEPARNNPLGGSQQKAAVDTKKRIGQPVKKGRINPPPAPKASAQEEDAHKMRDALASWHMDKAPLVQMLSNRTSAQRQTLCNAYQQAYEQDLHGELGALLSGDFTELLSALMLAPAEYDACCLHAALTDDGGEGCRDTALIGILCTRAPKELEEVRRRYEAQYGSELAADIGSGEPLSDLLAHLARGERERGSAVYQAKAEADAQQLSEGGVIGDLFRELFSSRNSAQLKATIDEYDKLGTSLEDSIRDAKLGEAEDSFLDIVTAVTDSVEFYARSLHKAIADVSSHDTLIVRIITSRAEVDLGSIKRRFTELSGRQLEDALKTEYRADNKSLLVAIASRK